MPSLLVLGDKGQLGQDFIARMKASTCEIVRGSTSAIDITQSDALLQQLNKVQPSIIVNCAAYTAVDRCESEEAVAHAVNGKGPGFLAEWAEKNNAFLMHISTDYVFPGDKPLYQAYLESDKTSPVNAYGRSKLAGEQAIQSTMSSNFAILRTAWVYGLHGHNFLKTMLRLVLANPEREFKIVDDQYGSPTWTGRLTEQMATVIAQRESSTPLSGLFHATAEGYCTWFEFAQTFFDLLGVSANLCPCTTADYPTPARRPSNSILENARFIEAGSNELEDWRSALQVFVAQHGDDLIRQAKMINDEQHR